MLPINLKTTRHYHKQKRRKSLINEKNSVAVSTTVLECEIERKLVVNGGPKTNRKLTDSKKYKLKINQVMVDLSKICNIKTAHYH